MDWFVLTRTTWPQRYEAVHSGHGLDISPVWLGLLSTWPDFIHKENSFTLSVEGGQRGGDSVDCSLGFPRIPFYIELSAQSLHIRDVGPD